MTNLIRTLEQAEAGSRELDREIAAALGSPAYDDCFDGEDEVMWKGLPVVVPGTRLPYWSTSVDAALTLIPEGWGAEIFWHDGAAANESFVELRLPNPRWKEPDCPPELSSTYAALVSSYDTEDDADARPRGRPLPLAICIAALRARVGNDG